jgi:hypoxanthine phosphoribosyltransferase
MKKIVLALLLLSAISGFSTQQDELDLIISQQEISAKIEEVATELNVTYKNKNLTIIMIMKGAICATADLIRHLTIPFNLEYIKASSYGQNGISAGQLTTDGWDRLDIENRDVLIIDDIFETGNTMETVVSLLLDKHPSSIKTLLLLVKDVPRKTTLTPDYTLFSIPNRFVIGYGLDYKELYRGLPGIYAFPGDKPPENLN